MPLAVCLLTLIALTTLLNTGSSNGSCTDSTRSDAAKLRYISDSGSAALHLYGSLSCEGKTTGMLNNLFMAHTKRHSNMIVTPPAGANSYY